MRLGRKSLLFGCHQFILHPLFVFIAWVKLNRCRNRSAIHLAVRMTPAHILACIVHDWGYWWTRTMDGPDGIQHSILGANIMYTLTGSHFWYEEVLLHSSEFAGRLNMVPSNFCWVDKYATAIMPSWLWASLAYMSGEGWEYLRNRNYETYHPMPLTFKSLWLKHQEVRDYTFNRMKTYYSVLP